MSQKSVVQKYFDIGLDCFRSCDLDSAIEWFDKAIQECQKTLPHSQVVVVKELITIHRHKGLSCLYNSKTRVPQNMDMYIQSLKEFATSLKYGEFDPDSSTENLQLICNIFYQELTQTDDISDSKIKISTPFLTILTKMATQEQYLTSEGKQSTQQPVQKMICEIWLRFCYKMLKNVEGNILYEDASKVNSSLDELKDTVEVTSQQISFLTEPTRDQMSLMIEDLRYSVKKLVQRTESLMALSTAIKMIKKTSDIKKKSQVEDTLILALDKLKEAEQTAPESDDKLRCWILVEIGLVHLKLQNVSTARQKFESALMGAQFMEENTKTLHWHLVAKQKLAEIRISEEEETRRKKSIQEITEKASSGMLSFSTFILSKHPPVHSSRYLSQPRFQFSTANIKKSLVTLIRMYHTDKVDQAKFSADYYLITEEILKVLNSEFNKYK